jgi:hypothetical protein
MESMTNPLPQPSLAPEYNLGSFFDTHGSYQGFGFNHIGAFWGLQGHHSSEDEILTLSSPSGLFVSLPAANSGNVDSTENMPTPTPSEPAVSRLETDAPAPSFTQTLKSQSFSNDKSNDANVPTINEPICQESDAWRAEDYCHVPRLTEGVYEEMTNYFARYNRNDEYWTTFTSSDFPPITHINTFVQVYFEEFHCLLPFLHKPTFAPTKDKWILSLSVAAIGCIFSRTIKSETTFLYLQEFLRRAINVQVSPSNDALITYLWS